MRTIFVVMDSLNRHYLNCYGDSRVHTPNIDRLAARGIVFDNHWAGSAPCMPARREMMTGRLNFLEAPWGPIEPWDDCLPQLLRQQKGTYSHLITDHYHYWEAGGEGYHTLFDTWEFLRGQEGDWWHPSVEDPDTPDYRGKNRRQDWVNRQFMDLDDETQYPTPQCFMQAIEFLENNHSANNWHLHLEVFDPHEPFLAPKKYHEMYQDDWDAYHFDWPNYAPVEEGEAAVEHIRKCYAAVLTMADHWLGKLLDKMDELGAWDDTTLILTADHGHMLGEHGYWAKNYMFDYKELFHIPLIVCTPETRGIERRAAALTASIDLMPTLMALHGAEMPPHVHGKSLLHLLEREEPHHDAVLYGYFAKDVNMTDGRYTYARQPLPDSFAHHHTLMPRGFRSFVPRERLQQAETGVFLDTAYGIPHLRFKVPSRRHRDAPEFNPIYDIVADPGQQNPIRDAELEGMLAHKMKELLLRCDAPECQYDRLGFKRPNR